MIMEFMKIKKICKKGMAFALAGAVSMSGLGTDAMAASTVSGSLNGFGCYGSISTDSTSAHATTTFGRGGANIKVSATVYYWSGDFYYETSMTGSNTAGGAGATATKKIGGADVVGGKGTHYAAYDSYHWGTETTKIGKIPSKTKKQ